MTIEIFLDIETIPCTRADIQARCVADVAPPGNYKKPESITQWWASEGDAKKAEAIARTALDGTWGEIICIGLAVNDEPAEVFSRGLTEADLLNTFGLMLDSKCRAADRSNDMWQMVARWIGHNIIDFDLRFLWQRSKLLDVLFPFSLPVQKNANSVYDTMKEWAGWKDRISQKDLELAFSIERKDPLPLGGADVFQAYKEGRIADIKEHCRLDIENLRQIYRRMTA
jgi:hypothetical protein